MINRSYCSSVPALLAVLAIACSTNNSTSGGGGSAGAGTGGASGQGGTVGSGGTATGGSAGAGGSSGGNSGGAGGISDSGSQGGANGTGGAADSGPAGGGTGADGGLGMLGGTPTRPQISSADAPNYTILSYLARTGAVAAPTTDNWDPTAGVADPATPTFTVGSGATLTIQSAIDAAITMGGTARINILVPPGTYREVVCVGPLVAGGAVPPITLYSTDTDATHTVIAYNNYAGLTTDGGVAPNRCFNPGAATYGTDASATFGVNSADFQAKNLTIANDIDETTIVGAGTQGVALHTRGDRAIFHNVRLLGNQDTVEVKSGDVNTIRRTYFKNCYVEGDVDFIFGRGVAVFDTCEIRVVTNRRANGFIVAPSTDARNPFGILFIASNFTGDTGAAAGSFGLGRAYDEGQTLAGYAAAAATGTFPNGQTLIRDSMLGAQINLTAPWNPAATTNRPYSSTPAAGPDGGTFPANRLYEFNNTGAGAATP
jgi:pectinesterase